MKRISTLLLLAVLTLTLLPARAEALPSAQELLAQYPVPEVALTGDPSAEPLLQLVNKSHKLEWDFVPELVVPNVPSKKDVKIEMQPEAAAALEALFLAAQAEGLSLTAVSGYRSYYTQKTLYQRSVEKNGKAHADLSSAQAGKSEHQLGLAVDISCAAIKYALNKSFAGTEDGKWIAAHCAEYGFILRYKTEWVKTTGYKGEPWHLRYVGKEHAALIAKLNVPFETYLEYLQLAWEQGKK